jgi:trimeric autotransporter adhesin
VNPQNGLPVSGQPVMAGEAVFSNVPAGTYTVSASYAGDANSLPATVTGNVTPLRGSTSSFTVVATAPPAPLVPTTTTAVANPSSITWPTDAYSPVGFDVTISGGSSSAASPTGTITIFDDGQIIGIWPVPASAGGSAAIDAQLYEGIFFDVGSNQIRIVYSGDSVYQSSETAFTYLFNLPQTPDFLFAPQVRQLAVNAGSSATAGFNLSSLNGYTGTVTLTCTPSSNLITCSLGPTTVTVNGLATTTLTVSASAQTGAISSSQRPALPRWPAAAGVVAFGLFFTRRLKKSSLWRSMLLSLAILACMSAMSCGGSSFKSSSSTPPSPNPAAAGYTVVVTATANGFVHNAVIAVDVP